MIPPHLKHVDTLPCEKCDNFLTHISILLGFCVTLYFQSLYVLLAASSALALSDIPWNGPVGMDSVVIICEYV